MRVLLLNQYYHPDVAPTAQLLADVGGALARRGHEVTALASARPYAGPGFRPLRDRHEGVRILRVPATALGRGHHLGRLVDYGTFVGAVLAPLLAGPRPDVVVALSTPPLVAALGLLVKRLRGARFVYWVMDVYPELAVALGALDAGSAAARALGALGQLLYAQADAVIALDDAMRDRLVAAGAAPERVTVIDNWADDAVRPLDGPNPLRRALALEGRFVVSYSGNMGLGHDFDTLLGAMAHLRGEDVHWLFIGDGPRRGWLEAEVRRRGADATFLPYRPRDELPVSLSAADASIVSLGPNLAGLIAPSKLYGILAAGVPVLYVGPPAGRTSDVIRRAGVGLAVDNGDVAGFARAIRTLKRDAAARAEMGRRGRRLLETELLRAHALERHVAVIERAGAGAPC